MKTILLSLSIICFTSALAQESVGEMLPKQSNWTFGWVYSPEVSYRILGESDLADENTSWIIDLRNENERVKFGQSFSLFFGYQLSKMFKLEAGLGYTDFGEGQKPASLIGPDGTLFATIESTAHVHVLSIPLTIHVNLGGNRVKGFIAAGIAPSYMARYTTYNTLQYSDGSISKSSNYWVSAQENYSRFILGASLSGGIDYQYSNKASLRIAPVFRITATDTYSDVPIRANYFNAGIELGTVYKL